MVPETNAGGKYVTVNDAQTAEWRAVETGKALEQATSFGWSSPDPEALL
jgi:hypothetical protein